jgi:hypothetical protein
MTNIKHCRNINTNTNKVNQQHHFILLKIIPENWKQMKRYWIAGDRLQWNGEQYMKKKLEIL